MDPIARAMFMGPARLPEVELPEVAIGAAFEGGYYAGLISHTANGRPTHALIVAPAATGATGTGYTLTTNKQLQNPMSVTNATSNYDGAANTALWTNSQAADFCTGLTIGGYSDWYLPARYELEIAYYNLKPSTTSNNTYPGVNPYAVPPRTASFTSSDPAQTSVTAFQTGNSEAFVTSTHLQSTETSQYYGYSTNFSDGALSGFFKPNSGPVRAFRKIAL
jgi:hypothetical protein